MDTAPLKHRILACFNDVSLTRGLELRNRLGYVATDAFRTALEELERENRLDIFGDRGGVGILGCYILMTAPQQGALRRQTPAP